MILPRGYVAIELVSEAGSIRFHEALAFLGTPEGRQGRPWADFVRDLAQTHTEVPDDDRAAWARLFLLRTEGEGEIPTAPAPGIRVWLPGEDVPGLQADPGRTYGAQLVGVPYLRRFIAYLGEGVEPELEPAAPVATTEPETEPAPEEPAEPAPGLQAEPEAVAEADLETEPEVNLDQVPEPEPERLAPQTTTPPVPLVAGASVIVESRLGGTWTTAFVRDGRALATDEARAAPWVDPRAPGRLTSVLKSALDRVGVPIERRAVREAIGDWISALQEQDGAERIVSAVVARAMSLTDAVQIEQTQPPIFTVTLGDAEIVFTNAEMASDLPKRLNELWMGAFYEVLGANKRDWAEIRNYWLSIAERGDPWGDRTPYDGVTSALQIRISAEPVFAVSEGLVRSGLYQDSAGTLWVVNTLIQEVLSTGGKDLTIAGFSAHLRREGHLVHTARVMRAGGIVVKGWGFTSEFRAAEHVAQVGLNTVRGESHE